MPPRKQYTSAFKLEIAKLMVEQNYTLAQACEVAGAGPWRQQYLAEQAGKPLRTGGRSLRTFPGVRIVVASPEWSKP